MAHFLKKIQKRAPKIDMKFSWYNEASKKCQERDIFLSNSMKHVHKKEKSE